MKLEFHFTQIKKIAAELWQQYNQYKIWAFKASMGAGKTTLIHTLCCDVLLVNDAVTSPTFAIINEYQSTSEQIIYHMDWYRLKNEQDVIQAGCADCIESGNLCFIEWSEKAPALLPSDTLKIYMEILNEQERRLIVKY
jgi:tRNA threonylcarbamoyladenosine biosynthesis protein TsaE